MRLEYYVLPAGDQWKIHLAGKAWLFDTQQEAMKVAVDTAQQAGGLGHEAQVLIRGEDGRWRAEWTYGQDPYPPSG